MGILRIDALMLLSSVTSVSVLLRRRSRAVSALGVDAIEPVLLPRIAAAVDTFRVLAGVLVALLRSRAPIRNVEVAMEARLIFRSRAARMSAASMSESLCFKLLAPLD